MSRPRWCCSAGARACLAAAARTLPRSALCHANHVTSCKSLAGAGGWGGRGGGDVAGVG